MHTADDVIDVLAGFIGRFTSTKPIRGGVNRVPMPDECVVLTEVLSTDLSRALERFYPTEELIPAPGRYDLTVSARLDIQVDFFGEHAAEECRAVANAYRTLWATMQFPDWLTPLYASDAVKTLFSTPENQQVDRWTITVSMQYNPIISVPQEYAEHASVNKMEDIP